jgi:hypothetical protein
MTQLSGLALFSLRSTRLLPQPEASTSAQQLHPRTIAFQFISSGLQKLKEVPAALPAFSALKVDRQAFSESVTATRMPATKGRGETRP